VNTFPGQAFDHAGLAEDANLLVPIDRLREMVNLGAIAELSPRVISLCGDIVHPQRLIEETAPQVAQMFRDDRADAVLLVPACPTCNQTVSLVAAEIERAGIPTVCQIYLKEAAEKLRPPRALWVPFPHGYALGHPSDTVTQRDVLKQTFALLEDPGPPPVLKDYRPLAAAVPDSRKA
jgi:D-proline reductase (dithiol) PrdB